MTTPIPDYTDLIARLEGPASVKDEFSAIHILAKDARAAAAAIRTLSEHRAAWERAAYDAVRAGV